MRAFFKCRCVAKLSKCDHNNTLCPSSSYRLQYDYEEARKDLQSFIKQDKEDKKKKKKKV